VQSLVKYSTPNLVSVVNKK